MAVEGISSMGKEPAEIKGKKGEDKATGGCAPSHKPSTKLQHPSGRCSCEKEKTSLAKWSFIQISCDKHWKSQAIVHHYERMSV